LPPMLVSHRTNIQVWCFLQSLVGGKTPWIVLVLDEDVKKAIQNKLPVHSGSSIVIIDVNTVDVSHIGPRTRSYTQHADSKVPSIPSSTTEAPRPTEAFDWQAEEQLCEEMIKTV
jgi:hypothetical protein